MPRKRVCVFGCDKNLNAYIHTFPHPIKKRDLFKKWMSKVGDRLKEKDEMTIYHKRKVCDYHFESHHKTTGHRLAATAIPTQYLEGAFIENVGFVGIEHNYCIPRIYAKGTGTGEFLSDHTNQPQREEETFCYSGTTEREDEDACVPEAKSPLHDTSEPGALEDESPVQNTSELGEVENEFSWQKSSEPIEVSPEDGTSWQETSEQIACPEDSKEKVNEVYRCNICEGCIDGFRYACLQCANFDLCVSCERRGAHESHYVLRVPAHRPYAEIEAVLSKFRSALLNGPHLLLPDGDTHNDVSVKSEPGEEDPLGPELPDEVPPALRSPLHSDDPLRDFKKTEREPQEDDISVKSDDDVTSPLLRECTVYVNNSRRGKRKNTTIQNDLSATDIPTDEPPVKARHVSEIPSELAQRHDVELDGYVPAQVTTAQTDGRSSSNVTTGSNIDSILTSGPRVVIERLVKIPPKNQSQNNTVLPEPVNTQACPRGVGEGTPYYYSEVIDGHKTKTRSGVQHKLHIVKLKSVR